MNGYSKYTPHPWLGRMRIFGLLLHMILPVLALVVMFRSGNRPWPLLIVAVSGFIVYLIFAILLHKEYFVDRLSSSILQALFGLALAMVAQLLFSPRSFGSFFAFAGALVYCSLSLSVVILLAAGSRLRLNERGGLTWRSDIPSLWRDPDFPPMARWTTGLLFIIPLSLGFIAFQPLELWDLYATAGCRPFILRLLYWAASLTALTWFYLRRLGDLAVDGHIFGPGSKSYG